MNLNWFESFLYGLFSGLTDILPVSAPAHKTLMLKIFGRTGSMDLLELLIHLAVALALYAGCRGAIVRMNRARKLALTPKKKRKRPLDVRSMMDMRLLRTIFVPVILGLLFVRKAAGVKANLMLLALFLFINGLILYIPQYLPGGNRDSRTLSRVEGLLMGLGGGLSAVPGISAMGGLTSAASICGVEPGYGLELALLSNLLVNLALAVYDLLAIFSGGIGSLSILILLRYLLCAGVAYGGATLGIRLMRRLAGSRGYGILAFYCFGLGLFVFILNLLA